MTEPHRQPTAKRPRAARPALLLLAACAVTAAASEPEAGTDTTLEDAAHRLHTHEPLIVDPALSFVSVLDVAVTRFPTIAVLGARLAESEALADASARWLSGMPSIVLAHLNDTPLDDRAQQEFDAGIELPLWRVGQKRAAGALGASASVEALTAGDALRWQITGMLRESLWDIARAENTLALARESVGVATELLRVVERRVAAGDLPQSDSLLARSALLEREIAAIGREAELLDAERGYRSLTGLDERPTQFAETRAAREDFDDTHPALAFANAEIDRARAARDLVEKSSRGAPSLTIAPHRQRDPLGTYYNNSLTMELRLPVGGRNYGATQRAVAERAVAEAESRRGLLIRELDLALHEAEHELSVIEQSLEVATLRADLAEQQWTLGQTAFGQGEIELRDLLRIQETVLSVRRDVAGLQIEEQRMIAMMNQALGELP